MRTITYFMWGFQPHFRSSLQTSAETLLKSIGFTSKPQALLVGFAAAPAAKWPICIEPENRHFQVEHLEGVPERAEALYELDPRSQMLYSDPRSRDAQHRSLRDQSRALAVVESLERADHDDLAYFVGRSTKVDDYDVHPVLCLPKAALDAVPQLAVATRDDRPVERSLVHSCVEVVLAAATRALFDPEPGSSLEEGLTASTEELARRAGANFVSGAVYLSGSYEGRGLFTALSAVSTTRYEGQAGVGDVVAAAPDSDALEVEVRLKEPLSFRDVRGARKVLEISERGEVALLTDGAKIFGLGHIRESYEAESERVFEFQVVGDGKWLMLHDGTPLLSVELGAPARPEDRIDRAQFMDTAERLFGSQSVDADRLWALAQAASEQAHGSMLVVSSAAESEAQRLSAQAILIDEAELSPELLYRATSIDGAALFSPTGACHALGVILDGVTTDAGNRARGSRFNSAVRYLATVSAQTMIVLVSEDGMIDVLPYLHPRISRLELEAAIAHYLELTNDDDPDRELRYNAFEKIEEFAFYLSEEQCALVNAAEASYQARELSRGGFSISRSPFRSDRRLNDSYFVD